jgi:hypothetical protein
MKPLTLHHLASLLSTLTAQNLPTHMYVKAKMTKILRLCYRNIRFFDIAIANHSFITTLRKYFFVNALRQLRQILEAMKR